MPAWIAILLIIGIVVAFVAWFIDEGMGNHRGNKFW